MKLFLGIFFIICALYFFLGNPETDRWPMYFGTGAVSFYKWLIEIRPYTQIMFFVFGVATLMLIKKP
jgi:hypothetical protein